MNPIKSQILGLLLGLATAIGCIFYEKIVHNFSFTFFVIIKTIEVVLTLFLAYMFTKSNLVADGDKLFSDSKYIIWCLIYIATGITTVLWFVITKNQGIMVGSIYEVKYIIMLALIYIAFGDNKFTLNTAIGVALAMLSIYFISKT